MCFYSSQDSEVTFWFFSCFKWSLSEKGIQELCKGVTGLEEDWRQLGAAAQDHRVSGGGLRRGAHPRAGQAERRGELPAAAGHAGRTVLPPARGRPPETLRPRPGVRHPPHLPAAHRPAERRPARERRQQRGAAHQRPGEEQGQAVIRAQRTEAGAPLWIAETVTPVLNTVHIHFLSSPADQVPPAPLHKKNY